MLAIPKPMLDALDLAPDAAVGLSIKSGRLVVDPKKRRRLAAQVASGELSLVKLRQKIEADPERPQFILTETGIGYRLRAPD